MYVSLLGDADIVKALLAAGASTEEYDECGETPLMKSMVWRECQQSGTTHHHNTLHGWQQ